MWVGSLGHSPANDTIYSDGDMRCGGGIFVGATGTDPAAGTVQIYKASGDPLLIFDIGGTDKWAVGCYDSNDSFRINVGGALGATTTLALDTSGNLAFGGSVIIGGDAGSDVAGYMMITDTATADTGTGTSLTMGDTYGSGQPTNQKVDYWLKAYYGTTTVYIPLFT